MSRKHEDICGFFVGLVQLRGRSHRVLSSLLCEAFIRDYATGSPVREIGKITWSGRGPGVKWEREENWGWHEVRLHRREEDAKERPPNLNSPYHQNGGGS